MRGKLEVIKHKNGLIEFRVQNRHVKFSSQSSMREAMKEARAYAHARPHIGFHITSRAA